MGLAKFAITIFGADSLFDKLSPGNSDKVIVDYKKALLRGAVLIEGEAKRLCPVDTGTLRRSITHTMPYLNSGKFQIDVGTNVEYAPFVEFGTGQRAAAGETKGYPITPSAYEAMAQMGYVWGGGSSGKGWLGMAARPFLFPAFEKYREIIKKMMLKAAVDALKKGKS